MAGKYYFLISLPTGSCRTRSSTGNCCVFPFIYRRRRYNSCTRVRSKRPWCAITPNYDHDKLYGYCGGRKRKKTFIVCCGRCGGLIAHFKNSGVVNWGESGRAVSYGIVWERAKLKTIARAPPNRSHNSTRFHARPRFPLLLKVGYGFYAWLRIDRSEFEPGSELCVVCLLGQDILTVPRLTWEYTWVPTNCSGNLTECWGVTCDGLASHPGGSNLWWTSIPSRGE